MPNGNGQVTRLDGTLDFSGGVDSVKVSTVAGQLNPNGLQRNQVAWANNVTMRGGGITTRPGWLRLGSFHAGNALYQGGMVYEPDGGDPYLLLSIGGHIFLVPPDGTQYTRDLSVEFGLFNPPDVEQAYFEQAEQFAVIQAGDFQQIGQVPAATLPLFWDGTTLWRSIGVNTDTPPAPPVPSPNEIPAATCMCYFQGRLWYAQNRQYSAGDIVGGLSGTIGYRFRDAVLKVTESPLVLGGDGFTIPTSAGKIRALKDSANLDATLGEGRLYIFTRKQVFALNVPPDRADWIATTESNYPVQTVVQKVNGSVNDRGVVAVNGDLYYQSLEPGIRSLVTAIRYFQQPGNRQIANNLQRILKFNDRALLHAASGIEFSNRLIMTQLPRRVAQGIVHDALVSMDFTPIDTFETKLPPIWEGMWEGLQVMQMFTADFGGLQRAFAVCLSREDSSLELWEFTAAERFDQLDRRISSYVEFPAFNWGDQFGLKKVVSLELWIDRLYGETNFTLEYRPDGDPCWYTWHKWQMCTARNSCEDVHNPVCYPAVEKGESYRATITLPKPPAVCNKVMMRPSNVGYQIQPKLSWHGHVRVRGIYLHAEDVDRELYKNLVC